MKEGRKLKNLDPINAVGVYIMPERNGASNQFTATIDITETERFIKEKRAEGMKGLGLMHIVLAAYVRTIATHPGVNRFIRGQKIYARNSVDMCLTIKKEFKLDAPEAVVKIIAQPSDTLEAIYTQTNKLVTENKKSDESNGTDAAAKFLKYIPGLLLKFVVWFLKFLDYFGLLPRALTNVSPFHGSMYITNMGSLGIAPVFHHLYDFGNLPLFCSIGSKRTEYKLNADGTVRKERLIDLTVVCDERICDGHYYASAFKTWKKHIENPSPLNYAPEKIIVDN